MFTSLLYMLWNFAAALPATVSSLIDTITVLPVSGGRYRIPTIDNLPCLNPHPLAVAAHQNGTHAEFWGRANSFSCPTGKEPGSCWLVVPYSTRQSLNSNTAHTFKWESEYHTLIVPGLYVYRSYATAMNGDGQPAYLIELRDKRQVLKMSGIKKQYNVRMPVPCPLTDTNDPIRFYSESLNAGALWTWQTCLDNIWSNLPSIAGAAPQLNWTPANQPENLRFLGVSAWDAYFSVLDLIQANLAYDPINGTFRIFHIGSSQNIVSQSAAVRNRLLFDYAANDDVYAVQAPENVRVNFRRRELYRGIEKDTPRTGNWEMSPVYSITVATGITGAIAGTIQEVWSHKTADYDSAGDLQNGDELETLANTLADGIANQIVRGKQRGNRQYSGIVTSVIPGAEIGRVTWRDFGERGGLRTIWQNSPDEKEDGDGESVVNEHAQPPDFARFTHPGYPETMQIVRVYDSGKSIGEMLTPGAEDLVPGKVIRCAEGNYTELDDCWILSLENQDKVFRNGAYLLARLCGTHTQGSSEKPIYLAYKENKYLGKAVSSISKGSTGSVTVWQTISGTESATSKTITCKALFSAISTSKWCVVEEVGGAWYVSQGECS